MALLPEPRKNLLARYSGPYTILQKVGNLDYIISTPHRRRSRRYTHVNMLKPYYTRDDKVVPVASSVIKPPKGDNDDFTVTEANIKLDNSILLADPATKIKHLSSDQQDDMRELIANFSQLFLDTPRVEHDVELLNTVPISQPAYRTSPEKTKLMQQEVDYMLKHDIIEECQSDWTSPCILIPKPDGSYRFCTDYRKVNNVTRPDTFPLPRINDSIDQMGNAKYLSTFDLLKGYWQVPLSDRARNVSSFITPTWTYRYRRMPFGMRNAPSTFQRHMNKVIRGVKRTRVYIDDVIIYVGGTCPCY